MGKGFLNRIGRYVLGYDAARVEEPAAAAGGPTAQRRQGTPATPAPQVHERLARHPPQLAPRRLGHPKAPVGIAVGRFKV